jgi:hypothetical protein
MCFHSFCFPFLSSLLLVLLSCLSFVVLLALASLLRGFKRFSILHPLALFLDFFSSFFSHSSQLSFILSPLFPAYSASNASWLLFSLDSCHCYSPPVLLIYSPFFNPFNFSQLPSSLYISFLNLSLTYLLLFFSARLHSCSPFPIPIPPTYSSSYATYYLPLPPWLVLPSLFPLRFPMY